MSSIDALAFTSIITIIAISPLVVWFLKGRFR